MHDLEEDVKLAISDRVFDLLTRQDKPGSTEKPFHGRPEESVVAGYSG